MTLRPCHGEAEWPRLVAIWRSSVEATHQFLTAADIDDLERRMTRQYLPAVEITVAQAGQGLVGFSGIADGKLEMLFIDAAARGHGAGSALLRQAVAAHPALRVDVNEQNPEAVGFYLHHGLHIVGYSPTDGEGRPFPLLQLQATS